MGYFGLGTRENKIAWGLIATFVILGLAFWIPGLLQYKRCLNQYRQCMCTNGNVQSCLSPSKANDQPMIRTCVSQHLQCRRGPLIVWSLGWLLLVVCVWLPCFYFCCCAKGPGYDSGAPMWGMYQANGMEMATAQPHGGQQYGQNPYGPSNPYGQNASYYPQQQQQQCAYPPPGPQGQPYMGYPVHTQQQHPYQPQQPQQQQHFQPHPQQQQQQGAPSNVPVSSY